MSDWDWERVVFDHVKVTVRDAAASVTFYKTALAALEIPPLWENERGAQFANLVFVSGDERGGPIHVAFVARSREQVDAFHRAAIAAGGGATTAAPASASSTAQPKPGATTPPSRSTPTATTSRPSSGSSRRPR